MLCVCFFLCVGCEANSELPLFCSGREESFVGNRTAKGAKNGYGLVFYANGDMYAGDFVNGFKEGNGTCVLALKERHDNPFQNVLS